MTQHTCPESMVDAISPEDAAEEIRQLRQLAILDSTGRLHKVACGACDLLDDHIRVTENPAYRAAYVIQNLETFTDRELIRIRTAIDLTLNSHDRQTRADAFRRNEGQL